MVTMKDYEGYNGFGAISQEEVDGLNKALTVGYQNPPTSGGNALRVESLEQTMRVLTFTQAHLNFFKAMPKLPAYSTVEEYNIQTSYGGRGGGFTNPGELPAVQDSAYARRTALVKFLTTQREVDHPTTLVRTAHGNVVAQQTQDGAIWLLQQAELGCWHGRSDTVAQSWDGLDFQIRSDLGAANNIIDLRGGILTEDNIEDATNKVIENYGIPTDLYGAPKSLSEMVKQFYPRERFGMPAPVNGEVGMSIDKVRTQAGPVKLNGNIFLRSADENGVRRAPSAATAARSPVAPTVVGALATGVATSKFTLADAGAYQYKVTGINRWGETAGVQESGGVTTTAALDVVDLTITNGADTSDATTGYRVYRSKAGGAAGTEQFIAEIPRVPGAATTVFRDFNQRLPGTSRAYLTQMNLQALSFRQLAPMMKVALATVALSIRWAQALYGTPIVYATKKFVIFDNVKDE